MGNERYDFGGYATRNDILCADGRTIRKGAFHHCDGKTVPLVWMHKHSDPLTVLGHALLQERDDGIYTFGVFNDTPQGRSAKRYVENGDITSLSIYANHLKQDKGDVLHGDIREVSLVLAGANPGAYIDSVMSHGEEPADEAIIFSGEEGLTIIHSDYKDDEEEEKKTEEEPAKEKESDKKADEEEKVEEPEKDEEKEIKHMAESNTKTVQQVLDTMNEEQKAACYALLELALADNDETKGEETMKHNVFDTDERATSNVLSHADMEEIFDDAKRCGSLKEAYNNYLEHAEGDPEYSPGTATYGIDGIDWLFPEAHNLNPEPRFIKRDTGWVAKVMSGVHHSPFSRIKSVFADITEDDARAKGYIKGDKKINEFFGLIRRTTTPQTVYKHQELDRDDVIDITDFDVVRWLKSEMRIMLDEELARAFLIGDGRDSSSRQKINPINIRPIVSDDDLFTIKVMLDQTADADARAKNFIKKVIKARKNYKGSGNPDLFTTEDMLTDMLLLTDEMGRDLYTDEAALCKKLRVRSIVTVEVMENAKGVNGGDLLGLIVNLNDYNVGADKGGAVSLFDDFDIDYNKQKYLIETRCSGALTVPYSAIAIEDYHA